MTATISIIMPTCGRLTLRRAIDSVLAQLWPGDELLVVGDGRQPSAAQVVGDLRHPQVTYHEHGPTGFFGNAQRNYAQQIALGNYLAYLDDDDIYLPEALATMRRAIEEAPGRPLMFCIECFDPPWKKWTEPVLTNDNVSGGAFVVPRSPDRVGQWPTAQHAMGLWGDWAFVQETLNLWPPGSLIWRSEVIYHVPRANNNAP